MPDQSNFDPNAIGLLENNIFGLPFSEEESALVLVPVPWEVTVSYREGTSSGPDHIFEASLQVDLYDPDYPGEWKKGYYMTPGEEDLVDTGVNLRDQVVGLLDAMENGEDIAGDEDLAAALDEVNEGCAVMTEWVYRETGRLMDNGKKVGLVGGDHSTPLGYIRALGDRHEQFGILQIDAHADLRDAYEGFLFSHASIMFNVLATVPSVTKLVQVGIRDYCDSELELINNSDGRIHTFFDRDIKNRQYEGETWKNICREIVDALPQKVYISFDIDGLDPKLCPNTGTPVPGGFEAEQVYYLFKMLKSSGRTIIGFDLNEVSVGDEDNGIDAVTGARVLYKLCNCMMA